VERVGGVVSDLDGECFAEVAFVAVAGEVELERLRLETERLRLVLDRGQVEVGLPGDGQMAASSSLVISTRDTPGLANVSRPA
jgi:hypothetical protein